MIEPRTGPVEFAIDRTGGDYRHFELPADPTGRSCQPACEGRGPLPGLDLSAAGLFRRRGALLSQGPQLTRPRAKPCCISGVVR